MVTMETTLIKLAKICYLVIVSSCLCLAVDPPQESSFNFAPNDVTASDTCSSSTAVKCNTTCPTRETDLTHTELLTVVDSECEQDITKTGLPTHINDTENKILFNSKTENCTVERRSGSVDSNHFFSLSTWIQINCPTNDCNILKIGTSGGDITLSYNGGLVLQMASSPTNPVSVAGWVHVTVRYNDDLWLFIDGKATSLNVAGITSINNNGIRIGPDKELKGSNSISLADTRWYVGALTDREIKALRTGQFQSLQVASDCRCPPDKPTLVPADELYLECKNTDNGGLVSRLNPDAHPAVYMIDGDSTTYWDSGTTTEPVTITLNLRKQFQIRSIKLSWPSPPEEMKIELMGGSVTQTHLYRKDCTGTSDCEQLVNAGSGYTAAFKKSFTTRSELLKVVADQIVITLTPPTGSTTSVRVKDLDVKVSCHCFGNDPSCNVTGKSYTCNCGSSNTMDDHCSTCKDETYRQEGALTCLNDCNCHVNGSQSQVCEKVGGKCTCKSNVDSTSGRQCTKCKFNTVNLGSDVTTGCTTCTCNRDGITSCLAADMTCACKPNVESTSGKCTACLDNYYDITNAGGCMPCACHSVGTQANKMCDTTSGQCKCKSTVQGRRCDECQNGHYDLDVSLPAGCHKCDCNVVGSTSKSCNKTSGQCPCINDDFNSRICTPYNMKLDPTYGPVAGGTLLTISGGLLGGRHVNVAFSLNPMQNQDGNDSTDAVGQTVESMNASVIYVRTKPVSSPQQRSVALVWSSVYDVSDNYWDLDWFKKVVTFEYKPNPTVATPTNQIKTFASGGCSEVFTGTHLDSVAYPKLLVYAGTQSEQTICSHKDGGQMTCKTPDVSQYLTQGTLDYGFYLDNNVINYQNVSSSNVSRLLVLGDPEIQQNQTMDFKNHFDQHIVIKGSRLNEACKDSDISITVGGKPCDLIERTADSLTCDPHETFPGETRSAEVKVRIGNLQVTWGTVKFEKFWSLREFVGIAVGGSIGIVLIVAVIIIICVVRRKRRSGGHNADTIGLTPSDKKDRPGNVYVRPPQAAVTPFTHEPGPPTNEATVKAFVARLHAPTKKIVKHSIVDIEHIVLGNRCTKKGQKMRVMDGHFGSASTYNGTKLTIKATVHPYPGAGEDLPDWLEKGLAECTRIQDYVHDNILRMQGIAVDEKNVYVLYPEMSKRTIKEYTMSEQLKMTEAKRIDLCMQVIEGVCYLHEETICHKDLAARNCWIQEDGIVKIADSSFSHDLYPEEYLLDNGRHIPVRWMAPESLRQVFYHFKSDVWSFGVLMWEVFTPGYLPYHDVPNNKDVKNKVLYEDLRLGQPYDCSDNLFAVIDQCHEEQHAQRPTAVQLRDMLTEIVSPTQEVGYLNTAMDTEEDYMNQDTVLSQFNQDDQHQEEDYENMQLKPPPLKPKPRRP